MFKHILVATDFDDSCKRALDLAAQMACESGAKLTLVNAFDASAFAYAGAPFATADLVTPAEESAHEQMEEVLKEMRARCPNVDAYVRHGVPADGIVATARDLGADLIVVGTHARGLLGRAFLGSVAESVLRASPVPVLVVRKPETS
jgi:nucleotide-binding universal stress UspA family protein